MGAAVLRPYNGFVIPGGYNGPFPESTTDYPLRAVQRIRRLRRGAGKKANKAQQGHDISCPYNGLPIPGGSKGFRIPGGTTDSPLTAVVQVRRRLGRSSAAPLQRIRHSRRYNGLPIPRRYDGFPTCGGCAGEKANRAQQCCAPTADSRRYNGFPRLRRGAE